MKSIFVYSPLSADQQQQLLDAVADSATVHFAEEGKMPDANFLSEMEILFGNPPVSWLENAHNLKFWQLDSAGFAIYCRLKLNAVVANMGDYFSRPCAETILGGILSYYRGLHHLMQAQMKKQWISGSVRQHSDRLSGKNVLLLGAGSIGREIKNLLQPFGCTITMAAQTNPEAAIHGDELLFRKIGEFDLVINTLPGSAIGKVSSALISKMKNGVVYASIGRGITTDEHALTVALQSGKIAGAILDVTEKEPLPDDSPLWSMPNVILTQHTGGGFATENAGKLEQFLRNFERYQKGEALQNQVELSRAY